MISDTFTPYEWLPLRNPKALRLLKILDQDLGDVPCCSLPEVGLDDQAIYIALSYSCGSPGTEATGRGVTAEICKQIFCENGVIPVTQNLSDFLVDIRRFHRHLLEEFIWIDAVCIDQDNLSERAAQIQMMGDFAIKLANNAAKGLPLSSMVVRRPDGLVLNAQKVDVIEDRVIIYNGMCEGSWIARTLPDILRFLCAFRPVYFDGQPRSQALWLTLASGLIKADLGTTAALEIYRPIFGLWVGECLSTLAANDLATYFRILKDLRGPIETLAQSKMDLFPGLSMLVDFPKVRTPQRDVTLAREKFRNMMNEPTSINRPVLFRTREGLLGKGTKNVRKGDEVWLIAGMPTPVVLRKTESENRFTKTDIVYVHGIMHGELLTRKDCISFRCKIV